MNNFGVIELASTKTTNAPGWAYVPDTGTGLGPAAASASLPPGNRKRAARSAAGGGGGGANLSALCADADARQEAKLRREIEALDRDNYHRDVAIAVPAPASRGARKHTPNVRKILQSQKTFANHLDDYGALLAHADTTSTAGAPSAAAAAVAAAGGGGGGGGGGGTPAAAAAGSRRATVAAAPAPAEKPQHKRRKSQAAPSRRASASGRKATTPVKLEEDVPMTDADAGTAAEAGGDAAAAGAPARSSILTPYARPHGGDGDDEEEAARRRRREAEESADPLLASRVPPRPSDAELRALLAAPPLSYGEARGRWDDERDGAAIGGRRYPPRVFCEVCGYWGRVRCMKCGARACALDCLETHREECVARYGL
ncbi:hypothetical protein GGS23DRAFT_593688 [Durotheca rogersii]|uniref:uncharacterized protein n=1 Tax=Durotheca rogersii TaxID=419775 RepID=UPI002220BC36|nr:uncharacterized protein GGS23DRAFT_593688 [Durotheca rogersii]KAI5866958.1 hypothetical protein GGS23DRAFT_593688 [Durotheca rogersii]